MCKSEYEVFVLIFESEFPSSKGSEIFKFLLDSDLGTPGARFQNFNLDDSEVMEDDLESLDVLLVSGPVGLK